MAKILIVRLGAMGDILHALPAATAIRAALPNATIGWLVEERWSELLTAQGRKASGYGVSPQSPCRAAYIAGRGLSDMPPSTVTKVVAAPTGLTPPTVYSVTPARATSDRPGSRISCGGVRSCAARRARARRAGRRRSRRS